MPEICRFLGIVVYILYDEGAVASVARECGDFQVCVRETAGELKPLPTKGGIVLVLGFDAPHLRLPSGLGEKGVLST